MPAIKLPPTTREYLSLTVTAEQDISGVNILVADMLDEAVPQPSDWQPVAADLVQHPDSKTIKVMILVTASSSIGQTRTIWYRLPDSPEDIARRAGVYVVA